MAIVVLIGNDNSFTRMAERLTKVGHEVHVFDVSTEDGMVALGRFSTRINRTYIFWFELLEGEVPRVLEALRSVIQAGDTIVDTCIQPRAQAVARAVQLGARGIRYAYATKQSPDNHQSTITFRGGGDVMVLLVPFLSAIADSGGIECTIGCEGIKSD